MKIIKENTDIELINKIAQELKIDITNDRNELLDNITAELNNLSNISFWYEEIIKDQLKKYSRDDLMDYNKSSYRYHKFRRS